eukprot:gene35856-43489_t
MIGRFGMSSSANSANEAPNTSTNSTGNASNTPTKALSSLSSLTSKMQKMNKMKLSDLTKKVSAGLSSLPLPIASDQDKAKQQEEQDKKQQMASVLALLEDVHLQVPSTHLGLVLAYNSKTQSPILHPHVKFTWYRMASEDRVEEVAESSRGWFAPSLDDVHCKLCVQIEDGFGQGCSRYLECGPLRPDPLLVSLAEAAFDYQQFEAQHVHVSLGLQPCKAELSSASSASATTALDADLPFVQLQGESTVQVGREGVFISLPSQSPHFNTCSRGLRLPLTADCKVYCASPGAVLLYVPVRQKPAEAEGPDASTSSAVAEDGGRLRAFLASAPISIPWSYEGHTLSPAAYLSPAHLTGLSAAEREGLERAAEAENVCFAQQIASLTDFVSALPDFAEGIFVSFVLAERVTRDLLALVLRGVGGAGGEGPALL